MADRTPRSARLPQSSVDEALPIAVAIDILGAPSSGPRIAQQLGVSPAGGAFRGKIAAATYYGFTERKKGVHTLSDRGRAAIGDDAVARRQAKREAVVGTSFGSIIRRFSGREPNASTVAIRLEEDFQVPSVSSAYLAETLIRSATEAEMISNDRFDAAAIESVAHIQPPATDSDGTPRRREAAPQPDELEGVSRIQRPAAAAGPIKEQRTAQRDIRKGEVVAGPFPPVQVVVKVDATAWSPEQVAELVRELRKPDAPTSPGSE